MSNVYRITPLEKKSISAHYEMFRSNPDGSTSWVNIEDHYRWGQGFISEDMDSNLPMEGSKVACCDPTAGWGSELEDQIACYFEFSDDLSDEEKQAIETAYREGGAGWLYEGEHAWEEEDASIDIIAPFKIDLCEDNGAVLQENIAARERIKLVNPSTAWPTN